MLRGLEEKLTKLSCYMGFGRLRKVSCYIGFPPLVLCLVVAGRLECSCDPQSYAGGKFLLLAGSIKPDRFAGEEPDKTVPQSSKLGVWRRAETLPCKNRIVTETSQGKTGFCNPDGLNHCNASMVSVVDRKPTLGKKSPGC